MAEEELRRLLLHSSAMLNAAIRIVRTDHKLWEDMKADESAGLWAEQVKTNMAVLAGVPDSGDNR